MGKECLDKPPPACCTSGNLFIADMCNLWCTTGDGIRTFPHLYKWPSKPWSSQLWTQFKQLRIEAWKCQDFNGVWTRDNGATLQPTELWSHWRWELVICDRKWRNSEHTSSLQIITHIYLRILKNHIAFFEIGDFKHVRINFNNYVMQSSAWIYFLSLIVTYIVSNRTVLINQMQTTGSTGSTSSSTFWRESLLGRFLTWSSLWVDETIACGKSLPVCLLLASLLYDLLLTKVEFCYDPC